MASMQSSMLALQDHRPGQAGMLMRLRQTCDSPCHTSGNSFAP